MTCESLLRRKENKIWKIATCKKCDWELYFPENEYCDDCINIMIEEESEKEIYELCVVLPKLEEE